jgi:cysteine desulfurase
MAKSNNSSNKKTNMIYLDYAASVSANPSSIHAWGVLAKNKLQNARVEVASVLRARAPEIIFTSGGTESNNLAIQGIVYAAWEQIFLRSSELPVPIPARPFQKLVPMPHIITTNIEHPSVLETCKMLAKRKLAQISIVSVEANGIIDPKKIKKEIKKNTVLVSVMYANNEIGTIQPIKEIAKEIKHYKNLTRLRHPLLNKERVGERCIFPLFHTDAVQAANYLDLNVENLGVDMLSLSGSKIEGAGRVGVLYKKAAVHIANVFGGGDQEGGLRPGTENLPEILKFSAALRSAQNIKEKETKRLTKLRNYFIEAVAGLSFLNGLAGVGDPENRGPEKREVPLKAIINGDLKNRLPNNVNITFPKIPSDLLVIELSVRGVMASSKSACKSSRAEGSYVIKAIRSDADSEIGGLRFSLGRDTTKKDIDYTVKALSEILTKLKKWYN